MDVNDHVELGSETHTRREALRKAAVIGAAAGAATVTGISIVPGVAQAASGGGGQQITAHGTARRDRGCFSGAGGDDQFLVTIGDGWWQFYFDRCEGSENVALAYSPPANPDPYRPPTGYKCKMQLAHLPTIVFDTGYVNNPINGISDTGGAIFIGPGGFWGTGDIDWLIICDPI